MKRNLLGLFAIVMAVAFSSFTFRTVDSYFVYRSTGDQSLLASYFAPVSSQPSQIAGSGILNWLKVTEDDGSVSQAEFDAAFINYDQSMDGSLNDETVITGALDRKNP